jgi:isoquinoline 1-oxidoreductase beta subunit
MRIEWLNQEALQQGDLGAGSGAGRHASRAAFMKAGAVAGGGLCWAFLPGAGRFALRSSRPPSPCMNRTPSCISHRITR